MSDAILRFAPSPTGGFHLGNARTALFNYLYARHYGAKLLLRVEDTDQERNTEAALQTILQGLEWLGIECDGEPVYQTHNVEAHRDAVQQLLENGHAYYSYFIPEELEEMRQRAVAEKRSVVFDRDLTAEQRAQKEAEGRPRTVRFRVPDGETVWVDRIRGESRWDNGVIGDFVILRADGNPTYNLAVVVDDYDMGVTLALRGADHISNTPKQIMLFKALGWSVPDYGHTTLILGSDGKKLSKRHGATTVMEYRDRGILPEALFNFLALLGWAPGDGQEFFSREKLIETFSIEGMLKKDAIFDEQKLEWLHGEHLRAKPLEDLTREAVVRWVDAGWISEDEAKADRKRWMQIVGFLQVRISRFEDFLEVPYFFKDPEAYDESVLKKQWKTDTPERLEVLIARLEVLDDFSEREIEGATRTLAGEQEFSTAKLIHPTRLALSGTGSGPGLFELMEVLGKETCLRRMRVALDRN